MSPTRFIVAPTDFPHHRFVDAEIGVRNLADNFRYNALPDIIQALDLTKGKGSADAECFEELEEYEQLATLVRDSMEVIALY